VTTEDDFQAALDAHPDDWQTRLVFADWLQERGDPRAEYFRLAGRRGWRPSFDAAAGYSGDSLQLSGISGDKLWRFYAAGVPTIYAPHTLPFDVGYGRWLHNTRREAENAAALAFADLPPERRAELLTAAPVVPAKKPRRRKPRP
jgi:uncharacterized protein (TIGR02996 family)